MPTHQHEWLRTACFVWAIATLIVTDSPALAEDEDPSIRFMAWRGLKPTEYCDYVTPRFYVCDNGKEPRGVKLEICFLPMSEAVPRIPMVRSSLPSITVSIPEGRVGDKIPIADTVLTVDYISLPTREYEVLEFKERKSALQDVRKSSLFAVCECLGGEFNALLMAESGFRVERIGEPAEGSVDARKFADLKVRHLNAQYDKRVSVGDQVQCEAVVFEVVKIVSAAEAKNRFGWIVFKASLAGM